MARALVVDDSAVMRGQISRILEDAGHEVRTARNGEVALGMLETARPDVVTLDLNMPGMDGVACLEAILARRALPVIMVSSETAEGAAPTIAALERGAFDFVCKPDGGASRRLDAVARELVEKVTAALSARRAPIRSDAGLRRGRERGAEPPAPRLPRRSAGDFAVVVIGASTGGPQALGRVLGDLPAGLDAAVVIAQHLPDGYTAAFARRLAETTRLPVAEVTGRTALRPGVCLVARGGADCLVTGARGRLYAMPAPSRPDGRWRPSVDRLVESAIASVPPERLVGALLTGMGNDGAAGFARLRGLSAPVIAQSERSAVVWGMPGRLVDLGGASRVLDIERIGPELARLVGAEGRPHGLCAGDDRCPS